MLDRARRIFGPGGFPVPVLLGVLPLHSSRHAEFLHNEVPGITIPDEQRAAMREAGARGAEVGLEMAMDLLSRTEGMVQGTYIMPSFGRTSWRPSSSGDCAPKATKAAHRPQGGDAMRLNGRGRRGVALVVVWSLLPGVARLRRHVCDGPRRAAVPRAGQRPARLRLRRHLLVRGDRRGRGTIKAIEDRTGAEVAVYTQVKPESDTPDEANADALALMNQWGVGREGFDDGLVILFDMQANLPARPGLAVRRQWLSGRLHDERRSPGHLRQRHEAELVDGDFDGALAIALRIDAAATPEHAAQLDQDRIINAAVGIGAPGAFDLAHRLCLVRWYTHGRDPIYIDDNSVLMPAPPDGLTPAMATLVMDDRTSDRTLSAAMVDLAARGLIQFRQDPVFIGQQTEVGVTGKAESISTPEGGLFAAIATFSGDGGFVPTAVPAQAGPGRDSVQERPRSTGGPEGLAHRPSLQRGRPVGPGRVRRARWPIALVWWTFDLDASGGLLGGVAISVRRFTIVMASLMPSRTQLGLDAAGDAGRVPADAAATMACRPRWTRSLAASRCRGSTRRTRRWRGASRSG